MLSAMSWYKEGESWPLKNAFIPLSVVFTGLHRWKKNPFMLKTCVFSCGENYQTELIRTKVEKEGELGVLGSSRTVELFVQMGKRKKH